MAAQLDKIDLILQYSLLVAGEADNDFDAQLGPIHLIKYVYLADLNYSLKNNGATFTEVGWQFYNYGPWANVVNDRIDPALKAIFANRQSFKSDFGNGDWLRFSRRDSAKLGEVRKKIPASITLRLEPVIKKFRKDTPALLDLVYRTRPMVKAAPLELLDFSVDLVDASDSSDAPVETRFSQLSAKKKANFSSKMELLRAQYRAQKKQGEDLVSPVRNARHDDVFFDGVAWLDGFAGLSFEQKRITVTFNSEVWKSESRKGNDVS